MIYQVLWQHLQDDVLGRLVMKENNDQNVGVHELWKEVDLLTMNIEILL